MGLSSMLVCLSDWGHMYIPCTAVHPHTSIHPLFICMSPIFHYVPHGMGTQGTSAHPICHRVFWVASVYVSGISVPVGTSISPQFIMVILAASHYYGSLLY